MFEKKISTKKKLIDELMAELDEREASKLKPKPPEIEESVELDAEAPEAVEGEEVEVIAAAENPAESLTEDDMSEEDLKTLLREYMEG